MNRINKNMEWMIVLFCGFWVLTTIVKGAVNNIGIRINPAPALT